MDHLSLMDALSIDSLITHPTVKSTKLMEYLIRLITPPGGTVLDPFMGSGSTGVAAVRAGFGFVGIEKESDYLEIAKKRLV
jgi:site-specific DNA-methyltransferase (adenine-specific)